MDIYSKAIFTVIAVALCVLAIENAGSRARAERIARAGDIQRIAICSPDGNRCAEVAQGGSALGVGPLRITTAQ